MHLFSQLFYLPCFFEMIRDFCYILYSFPEAICQTLLNSSKAGKWIDQI